MDQIAIGISEISDLAKVVSTPAFQFPAKQGADGFQADGQVCDAAARCNRRNWCINPIIKPIAGDARPGYSVAGLPVPVIAPALDPTVDDGATKIHRKHDLGDTAVFGDGLVGGSPASLFVVSVQKVGTAVPDLML